MCQVTAGARAVGLGWDPLGSGSGPSADADRPEGVTPHSSLLSSLYLRSRISSLQDHCGEFWSSPLMNTLDSSAKCWAAHAYDFAHSLRADLILILFL